MATDSNAVNSPTAERLLVVSGGGSRGAWAVGLMEHLAKKFGNNGQPYQYRHVWGTSTGSLMAPLILLNDFETLKEAYTSVEQKDIFDVSCFKEDGSFNKWVALQRLLTAKKTFGESNNLHKLIHFYFPESCYNQIINAQPEKQFTVCTTNFKNGNLDYNHSSQEMSWKEMCSWIWASSNQPLLMTFVGKPYLCGGDYVDGGVMATLPVLDALKYAKEHQIKDIDIIINHPLKMITDIDFEPADILKNLLRLTEFWKKQVLKDNINIALLLNKLGKHLPPDPSLLSKSPVNLHLYFFPAELYQDNKNELIFNKDKMKCMLKEGEKGNSDSLPGYEFVQQKSTTIPISAQVLNDDFLNKLY